MSSRPTPRFWWLLAAGFLLAAIGAWVPGAERILIPYDLSLLALFALSGFVARRRLDLELQRRVGAALSVSAENRVLLDVRNRSRFGVTLTVRDEIPVYSSAAQREYTLTIEPRRTKAIEYFVLPDERGRTEFRGTAVRVLAPLGLAWVQAFYETSQAISVYPNVKAVEQFDLLKQKGRLHLLGVRRTRYKGIGTEFESLRDYSDDDYRHIDWKSTARRGKLVVRDFELERNQAVIVCVDVGRTMLTDVAGRRKADHILDAALILMHAAEAAGDQIGFMGFNDAVRAWVAPRKGRRQVGAIMNAVFDLQPEPVQSGYDEAFGYLASRWKRRALVVVFADPADAEEARELASALGSLRRRHVLLVVSVSDPRLKELAAQPIDDYSSLYRKSAALWHGTDRRDAVAVLEGSGIRTLSSEPEELAAALVNTYLRIKERSLI